MHIYTYTCRIHIDAIIKTSEDFFKKIYVPLTLFVRFACERELETEQRLQHIDLNSFSFLLLVCSCFFLSFFFPFSMLQFFLCFFFSSFFPSIFLCPFRVSFVLKCRILLLPFFLSRPMHQNYTHMLYSHNQLYKHICIWDHNDTMKTSDTVLRKIYLSLYLKGCVCERELETEQNCNILTPTLMAISVFFPLSRAAQPEAWGPLCWMLAFSTASCYQRVWSPNPLPVHQSMTVLWDFTLSYIVSQTRLRDFFP